MADMGFGLTMEDNTMSIGFGLYIYICLWPLTSMHCIRS